MQSMMAYVFLFVPFFTYCRVALVKGKFPDFLLEAWDDYDFRKDSDNDRPGKLRMIYIQINADDSFKMQA